MKLIKPRPDLEAEMLRLQQQYPELTTMQFIEASENMETFELNWDTATVEEWGLAYAACLEGISIDTHY